MNRPKVFPHFGAKSDPNQPPRRPKPIRNDEQAKKTRELAKQATALLRGGPPKPKVKPDAKPSGHGGRQQYGRRKEKELERAASRLLRQAGRYGRRR